MRLPHAAPSSRFVVSMLLAALSLLNASCTNTLNRAIYREKPEAIQKFLAAGANVNEANDDGSTPLIYAAQYADLPLIQTLIERGAAVNAVNQQGNSALSYLVSGPTYKNKAIALVLAKGANVNLANHKGCTPLHLAAARPVAPADVAQQIELISMLLGAGADAMCATNRNELPIHFAAAAGQPDQAMELLIQVTKEPQGVTVAGYNALSEAAKEGHLTTARFLIEHGFEPQDLASPSPSPASAPVTPGVVHPINAHAREALGDVQLNRGEPGAALASYQRSAASYDSAVSEYEQAVNFYSLALKDAKEGRKKRLISTIALNAVGTGLGLATGVGFVSVPKRINNHIDDYAEELERNQTQLTKLTQDRTALAAKLQATLKVAPPDAAVHEAAPEAHPAVSSATGAPAENTPAADPVAG